MRQRKRVCLSELRNPLLIELSLERVLNDRLVIVWRIELGLPRTTPIFEIKSMNCGVKSERSDLNGSFQNILVIIVINGNKRNYVFTRLIKFVGDDFTGQIGVAITGNIPLVFLDCSIRSL